MSSELTSDADFIMSWNDVSSKINCYFSIFLFLFGFIGNMLNILVLSKKPLRSNPCAWLFLLSSIFNLIAILSGLTTRMLSNWTNDITDTRNWLCKFRIFTLYTSRTIASWLIMLATIDRWLLSCLDANLRQMSTLKRAQQGAAIIILFSACIYSPIIYCYEANLMNTPLRCYSKTIACQIFADQTYTCVTILLPLILMFIFGFLTLSNVRKIKHRLNQSPLLPRMSLTNNLNDNRHRYRTIDRYLLLMLFVQITFLTLFTFPQAIQQIYLTITRNHNKTSLRKTIENSIYSFGILLTYLANGMPFYIYTLSGGFVFRQAFYDLMKNVRNFIFCQRK